MLNKNEIIDFFKLNNSHAKKELGQNFLINEKIIQNIVKELEIKEEDSVLEIGPGLGALTGEIIGKSHDYTVVEYDAKFVDFLGRSYENQNIKIVKNNILKFKEFSANKVIGNLPYYITTDILEYIILNFKNLDMGVFMVQKECLNRILALDGKDYNAINVLIADFYDIKTLFIVKKDNFFPEPNVESVVFKITKKQEKNLSFAGILYKTARILFANRRKTVSNNLNNIVRNKELTSTILLEAGIDQNMRAEQLKIIDFNNLASTLLKYKII